MTFRDTYGITLHTMRGNKSRCVLTAVIAAFLSVLVMGMLSLAISFSQNSKAILNQAYFSEGAYVSVEWNNKRELLTPDQPTFTGEYYAPFREAVDSYSDMVDLLTYKTNLSSAMDFIDPKYSETPGINIIQGRQIAPSEKSNEAIVSRAVYEKSLSSWPYAGLEIGTTHTISASYRIRGENKRESTLSTTIEYVVVGIYEVTTDQNVIINGQKNAFNYQSYIGDIGLVFALENKDVCVESALMYHRSKGEAQDPSALLGRLNGLNVVVNKALPQALSVELFAAPGEPVERIERYHDGATCPAYEALMKNDAIRFIVLGSALVFAVILLAISIGSLVNSVIISIDGSKKFIGILKALGMRNRSLTLVIALEMITLIGVGVLIGYLLLFALLIPLHSLMGAVIGFAYSAYMEILVFSPSFSLPIYVFFGALAVFLLLTYIFSKRALHKAIKANPIEVINEVS